TVRAHLLDGRTASDTTTARVVPPKAVPAALAGSWRRTLSHVVPADPGAKGAQPGPAGPYTMTFDPRWVDDRSPGTWSSSEGEHDVCNGCIVNDDYVAAAHSLRVWGSVIDSPSATWKARGGWWCDPDGPPATYSWSVSGKTLTLAPRGGRDACHQR